MTNNRFVLIDCAEKVYTVYVDGKAVNSIESAEFIEAGLIERFRVHTDDVMEMVDGEE